MSRGLAVTNWAGSGFNSYSRAMRRNIDATHVCEACVFVCSRITPVPGRPPKEGKKFGGCYRNYSHAAEDLGDRVDYINTTKAETARMVDWIRRAGQRGPWAVAIAVSGQKHVVPTAPVNAPGQDTCQVAVEEIVLRISRRELLELIDAMNRLRASSGCSVDALMTGQYHPKDLARDLEGVRAFESEHERLRGGGVFELAAFLTSKNGGKG